MSELRNVFVGLRPMMSVELEKSLADVRDGLRQGARPKLVRPVDYHLTVAFMGLPDRDVAEALFRKCAEMLGEVAAFEVTFRALSAFGKSMIPCSRAR